MWRWGTHTHSFRFQVLQLLGLPHNDGLHLWTVSSINKPFPSYAVLMIKYVRIFYHSSRQDTKTALYVKCQIFKNVPFQKATTLDFRTIESCISCFLRSFSKGIDILRIDSLLRKISVSSKCHLGIYRTAAHTPLQLTLYSLASTHVFTTVWLRDPRKSVASCFCLLSFCGTWHQILGLVNTK